MSQIVLQLHMGFWLFRLQENADMLRTLAHSRQTEPKTAAGGQTTTIRAAAACRMRVSLSRIVAVAIASFGQGCVDFACAQVEVAAARQTAESQHEHVRRVPYVVAGAPACACHTGCEKMRSALASRSARLTTCR